MLADIKGISVYSDIYIYMYIYLYLSWLSTCLYRFCLPRFLSSKKFLGSLPIEFYKCLPNFLALFSRFLYLFSFYYCGLFISCFFYFILYSWLKICTVLIYKSSMQFPDRYGMQYNALKNERGCFFIL